MSEFMSQPFVQKRAKPGLRGSKEEEFLDKFVHYYQKDSHESDVNDAFYAAFSPAT